MGLFCCDAMCVEQAALNSKYNKSWGRVVGKHSDVPGMSRSAIPTLVKHGLKAYHIGRGALPMHHILRSLAVVL